MGGGGGGGVARIKLIEEWERHRSIARNCEHLAKRMQITQLAGGMSVSLYAAPTSIASHFFFFFSFLFFFLLLPRDEFQDIAHSFFLLFFLSLSRPPKV